MTVRPCVQIQLQHTNEPFYANVLQLLLHTYSIKLRAKSIKADRRKKLLLCLRCYIAAAAAAASPRRSQSRRQVTIMIFRELMFDADKMNLPRVGSLLKARLCRRSLRFFKIRLNVERTWDYAGTLTLVTYFSDCDD